MFERIIDEVLRPLIGDLHQNGALKQWQRDILWTRLEELKQDVGSYDQDDERQDR